MQIKVVSPPIGELKNELVIERWLPWTQLHPSDDETTDEPEASTP